MECPNCGSEMVKGNLIGDRYAIKWQPADKKLVAGIFANGGFALKDNSSLFGRPKTEAYVCENCELLTVDLKTQRKK
ncbi:PF20097 family protein [Facklamia sp. 7083-14-GEN3]|uniref:PF20097 family protein n=1 Tax=Facklamia sp. 7083-14-GEN3 TaxID=2973478 RepID=UPI00215CAC0B|nr:PF20097 family protein [Facklamia sp. 7083-14-GEN3]MCR8969081.1 PF20097 family protein [Facklamia sp. 7083-14-GEN3]